MNRQEHGSAEDGKWPALWRAKRHLFYAGLLLFVVLFGLPLLTVPALRHRLTGRVGFLKAALVGERKPLAAQVGQNQEPLPPEFQRQAPAAPQPPEQPPGQPPAERLYAMRPDRGLAPVPARPRVLHLPPTVARTQAPETRVEAGSEEAAASSEAEPAQPEIKYQKGKMEQEAYELLLKSKPAVAAMVQGQNASLQFKSWDAASRGGDVYWVRLIFRSGDNDEEYIWQVKLESSQVTPLSYNARSVS